MMPTRTSVFLLTVTSLMVMACNSGDVPSGTRKHSPGTPAGKASATRKPSVEGLTINGVKASPERPRPNGFPRPGRQVTRRYAYVCEERDYTKPATRSPGTFKRDGIPYTVMTFDPTCSDKDGPQAGKEVPCTTRRVDVCEYGDGTTDILVAWLSDTRHMLMDPKGALTPSAGNRQPSRTVHGFAKDGTPSDQFSLNAGTLVSESRLERFELEPVAVLKLWEAQAAKATDIEIARGTDGRVLRCIDPGASNRPRQEVRIDGWTQDAQALPTRLTWTVMEPDKSAKISQAQYTYAPAADAD